MSCPGDLLSGLVDGELDHPTRERVLTHLVSCPSCQRETEDLRELKGRLSWAGAQTPPPSEELLRRLSGVAVPGVAPLRPRRVGLGQPRTLDLSRRSGANGGPPRGPWRRRSVRRRTVGGLVALGLGAAFVLGGQSAPPPPRVPIDPTTDQFVSDYVNATLEVPVTQPVDAPFVRGTR